MCSEPNIIVVQSENTALILSVMSFFQENLEPLWFSMNWSPQASNGHKRILRLMPFDYVTREEYSQNLLKLEYGFWLCSTVYEYFQNFLNIECAFRIRNFISHYRHKRVTMTPLHCIHTLKTIIIPMLPSIVALQHHPEHILPACHQSEVVSQRNRPAAGCSQYLLEMPL